MKKILCILLISMVVFLTGCQAKNSMPVSESVSVQQDYVERSYEGAPAEPMTSIDSDDMGGSWTDTTVSTQDENIILGNRVVLKNADLVIVVDSPADRMDDIKQIAANLGGYVSDSRLYKRTTSNNITIPEATITIRVPAETIDSALSQIKELVADPTTDIVSESVTAQDVTKEYTDLSSRLKNLQNTEEQLQIFLDQATKTEDVMKVYNELTQVREQIEVLQGEINYYNDAAALSTISINLKAQESVEPLTIGQWKPSGVAQEALQALINALKFFVNAGIWIVIFLLPIIIIIALPFVVIFYIIRRIVKRRKAQKAAKSPVNIPQPQDQ